MYNISISKEKLNKYSFRVESYWGEYSNTLATWGQLDI